MKNIIIQIILLPNIPFVMVLTVYLYWNIRKNTDPKDMPSGKDAKSLTDDLKRHIDKIHPVWLRYAIGISFYTWFIASVW